MRKWQLKGQPMSDYARNIVDQGVMKPQTAGLFEPEGEFCHRLKQALVLSKTLSGGENDFWATHPRYHWIPAFAGMTIVEGIRSDCMPLQLPHHN
jgi:hypothetical protein